MKNKKYFEKQISPFVLRKIETVLSDPLFHGVPIGPTLNDDLTINFYNKRQQFDKKQRVLSYIRMFYHALLIHCPKEKVVIPPVRPILVTCLSSIARTRELVIPVVETIGREHCIVVCIGSSYLMQKSKFFCIEWNKLLPRAASIWRSAFLKNIFEWQKDLKILCKTYHLPKGALEYLSLRILHNTQVLAGCIKLLSSWRPKLILTEADRNTHWSCLVLAAKAAGIPTMTLVHGVMNQKALGYAPVLADKILCWGRLQEQTLITEGVEKEKIEVVGCPRLNRSLPMTAIKARKRMGFDLKKPAVMFATSPIDPRLLMKTLEAFCFAAKADSSWTAFVRIHPSENLSAYRKFIQKFPDISFFENSQFSLDVSLAAADLVVVRDSGVGSDALIKGRLSVVLSMDGPPVGHGAELVQKAGCPLACSTAELVAEIQKLLFHKDLRRNAKVAAEAYVADFCEAFGKDSATKILEVIKKKTGFYLSMRATN